MTSGMIAARYLSAIGIFAALAAAGMLLEQSGALHRAPPWANQAILKTALLAAALALILADRRRSAADYGFRRPVSPHWTRQILLGGVLGAIATTLIFITPAEGMRRTLAGFGLLDLVLWIWLYSTFTEEVFTRGWFQTIVTGDQERAERAAIAASALLFGAMHLSLLFREADFWTVAIIVTMTTALGYVAAIARHRSFSIWPAIVAHLFFNVGGTVAGIVLTIISTISKRSA
jgi:membrane protease YdiL (CAAX protease family)